MVGQCNDPFAGNNMIPGLPICYFLVEDHRLGPLIYIPAWYIPKGLWCLRLRGRGDFMWLRTPQKLPDAWLCAQGNWPNHSETWAAVPFCIKNCPNWHQTVLGGENWPTTCVQHAGTTWQAFPPNYFVAAFITTLRECVQKLKAPTPILHPF